MSDLEHNLTLSCSHNFTFLPCIHIPVACFIALLCLLGNLPLFWMYATTYKTLKDKLFEVSLGVVDVIACTLLLGVITFIQGNFLELIACSINLACIALSMLCLLIYLFLCLSIAVVRFVAVYFPAKYKKWKFKITLSLVVASFLVGSLTTLMPFASNPDTGKKVKTMIALNFSIRIVSVSTTLTLYMAIFVKLWRSRQIVTGVRSAMMQLQQVVPNETDNGRDQQNDSIRKQVKKRAKHVLIAKMFGAITACFFVTATASMLVAIFSWSSYWLYLNFINFVINPVIYFWLNQDFRKSYISFWRKAWKKAKTQSVHPET